MKISIQLLSKEGEVMMSNEYYLVSYRIFEKNIHYFQYLSIELSMYYVNYNFYKIM